jgi:hypothetical protein
MATSEQIKQEQQNESICEICGRTMELIVIRNPQKEKPMGQRTQNVSMR